MMRATATAFCVALAAFAAAPPAAAADLFAGALPLGAAELALQRGGFVWAGLEISLGVDILTTVNGVQVLHASHILSDLAGGASPGPAGSNSLTLSIDNGGNARIGQALAQHAIPTNLIVVNSANDVAIVARMTLDVTLSNFARFRANAMQASRLGALGRLTSDGALGALRR